MQSCLSVSVYVCMAALLSALGCGGSGMSASQIQTAQVLFDDLIERKGLSVEDARKSMLRTEPFQKYPALVAKLESKK